jgi:DNA polymerase-3 subunit gamma/tau
MVRTMGQALYRKYRSKKLSEIVGQEHVTATLANALKAGKVSHAYLLSGPRGVGKTSIARILAHEINDLPYDDATHLDIIEIDAASNRRIDEIRDLRERVNTAPASAKYKVYIIDEVHMLTKEAFNALLKTLEEPPAHVVFILATTEAHKLPETIISRTQRYSLRPVPEEQVIAHLKTIAKGEKLQIDDDALQVIAAYGEGSFRDSISLLDQASSISEHVTRADVERILGLAPQTYIAKLKSALTSGDSTLTVTTLAELQAQGFEAAMIAQQLGASLRAEVVAGTLLDVGAALHLLQKLLDIPAARSPKQLLEIVLLQAALPANAPPSMPAKTPKKAVVPAPEPDDIPAPKPHPEPPVEPVPPPLEEPDEHRPGPTPATLAGTQDVTELWRQSLDEIKKQYNTLYGIARMASPEFDGATLTLSFKFAFHQKRLNEAKNRKIFADVVERLYGKPVQIVCVVAEPTERSLAKPDVAAISNIFGCAELLES